MNSAATLQTSDRPLRLAPRTDLLGANITGAANWAPSVAILNSQGKPANVIWVGDEFYHLCRYLHNDNNEVGFIMGFNEDGKTKYVRSMKKRVSEVIPWAFNSIVGKARKKVAYVPYSTNSRRESRWGAMDFDAHNPGDEDRARSFAFAAYMRLLNSGLILILESTGRGWHVWVISDGFHPVNHWIRILKEVARDIGAPLKTGVCEIFPPDSLRPGCGKGMRAPGSWNPATETLSEIFLEDTAKLFDKGGLLSSPETEKKEGKKYSFLSRSTGDAEIALTSSPVVIYSQWEKNWRQRFSITLPQTRNAQLRDLVGHIFRQVGFQMASEIVKKQFQEKTVETRATLEEHYAEFRALWAGCLRTWLQELPDSARRCWDSLATDHEKDAFKIIFGFFRKAVGDNQPDFPVAIENLGGRLGITKEGASKIRKKFVALAILDETQPYIAHKRAARFVFGSAVVEAMSSSLRKDSKVCA